MHSRRGPASSGDLQACLSDLRLLVFVLMLDIGIDLQIVILYWYWILVFIQRDDEQA